MLTNFGLIKRKQEMMHSMRQSRSALRAKRGYIRNGGMNVSNAAINEWTRQIRVLLKANGILRGQA
jgi:flagellar hook-associated protein FlgK